MRTRPGGGPRELAIAGGGQLRLRQASAQPAILELSGELDLDTVPQIDGFLRRSIGPLYQQQDLVMDLQGATLVDSSFLAFVFRLVGALRANQKELVLTRPVGQVRRVVALVGLHNVVPVFESVEEAVALLVRGPLPLIPPAFSAARV